MNDKTRIVKYFIKKSVFKFDVIENDDLINVLDDIELIMVVSKDNNYMDKQPMVSILLKNTSAFLKYVKYTQHYELSKLARLKFLNKFRAYCQKNNLVDAYYKDEMLVSLSNLQQQLQASIIEEYLEDIKEIIKETINTDEFVIRADDTPLISIVFNHKMKYYIEQQNLIKENISSFIKHKMNQYTHEFDDILKVELIDEQEKK